MELIKILIVEDQELVRDGLEILLNMQPNLEVVGTAENGRLGISFCEELKPNVVLMDINMPEMDGVLATQHIKTNWPQIKVIILTTYQEINYVVEALSVGAEGFLLKAIKPKDLADGIRLIYNGRTLIPPIAAKAIFSEYKELKNREQQVENPVEITVDKGYIDKFGLTDREAQVLKLITDGYNNYKISETLFLSEGTVKNYISSIYSKMHVNNRKEVAKIVRQG